jgi:hypothetical protein
VRGGRIEGQAIALHPPQSIDWRERGSMEREDGREIEEGKYV